ncbi:MAG: hypothetical protein ACRDOY_03935, partial [Nocardioidaceae bacterium]
ALDDMSAPADSRTEQAPKARAAGWPLSAVAGVLLLVAVVRWAPVPTTVANLGLLTAFVLLVAVAWQTSHPWLRTAARVGVVGALVVTSAMVGAADPTTIRALTHIDTTQAPWGVTGTVLATEGPGELPADCPRVLTTSRPLAAAMARGWRVDCTQMTALTAQGIVVSGGSGQLYGATHLASRTVYLRSSYRSDQLALWTAAHEVGHTIDHDLLTPSARQRFLIAADVARWTGGPYALSGREIWAQSYAACTTAPHEWVHMDRIQPVSCARMWAAL